MMEGRRRGKWRDIKGGLIWGGYEGILVLDGCVVAEALGVMTLGTPTNRKRMSRKESRRNVYTRPTSRPYNPPWRFPALVRTSLS